VPYDPDRIKRPMRRIEGGWEQVSWEEALGEIANALQGLRDSDHPERMVFLHDGKRGPTSDLIARFCRAFGTPNDVRHPRHSADGSPLAWPGSGWCRCRPPVPSTSFPPANSASGRYKKELARTGFA
jgi:anaerobic selenocysteine-containing dehydrogenase